MRALKAGGLYFLMVFGAGFVLGTIRQLLLVPRMGEMWAELLEMPLMLAVIVMAARRVVRRLRVPPGLGPRLAMGLTALGLLIGAEIGLVLEVRGIALADYIAGREPVSGTVYLLMLVVYAAMPWLVRGKSADPGPGAPYC
jgi:hypothetical protein